MHKHLCVQECMCTCESMTVHLYIHVHVNVSVCKCVCKPWMCPYIGSVGLLHKWIIGM